MAVKVSKPTIDLPVLVGLVKNALQSASVYVLFEPCDWETRATFERYVKKNLATLDEYGLRFAIEFEDAPLLSGNVKIFGHPLHRHLKVNFTYTTDPVEPSASKDGFTLGDVVEWTSQAHGRQKTKRGMIVQVVPPKGRVNKTQFPTLWKKSGLSRDHESYVVHVEGPKGGFYWPRVIGLRKVG